MQKQVKILFVFERDNYENNLKEINTIYLIEEFLNSNDTAYIYFYNNVYDGINYIKTNNDYYNEFHKRDDYFICLLSIYENLDLLANDNSNYYKNYFVEMMLAQPEIINNITNEEYDLLQSKILQRKTALENVEDYVYDKEIFEKFLQYYNTDVNGSINLLRDYEVFTPNGSLVTDITAFGGEDLLDEDVARLNQGALDFNVLSTIDLPTKKYNCHSYAWYSQDYNTNEY